MVASATLLGGFRHLVENALYDYATAADALDVGAIVRLLAAAEVRFGSDQAGTPGEIESLFRERFENAPPVKHLLSNVRIQSAQGDPDLLHATCQYVRISLADEPVILSLGTYSAEFEVHKTDAVKFRRFTVSPQWVRP